MKDKSKILYERALITCLIMLFICIAFKLFGFNYFNLNTDIPILKEIDNVVMNNDILSFLYSVLFKFANGYLVCIIATKTLKIDIIDLLFISIVSTVFTYTLKSNTLTCIYDTVGLYSVCFKKTTLPEYMYVFAFNIIYQLLSLFTRNVPNDIYQYNVINTLLLNIDYYIMLIITYLYLKKGDTTLCQLFHHFGSSLATKLWKKRSENYSNKGGK